MDLEEAIRESLRWTSWWNIVPREGSDEELDEAFASAYSRLVDEMSRDPELWCKALLRCVEQIDESAEVEEVARGPGRALLEVDPIRWGRRLREAASTSPRVATLVFDALSWMLGKNTAAGTGFEREAEAALFVGTDFVMETWLRYQGEESPWDGWSWDAVFGLVLRRPDDALDLLVTAADRVADDPDMLELIGAGPLEDLIMNHSPDIVGVIEAAADEHVPFRQALGYVWIGRCPTRSSSASSGQLASRWRAHGEAIATPHDGVVMHHAARVQQRARQVAVGGSGHLAVARISV